MKMQIRLNNNKYQLEIIQLKNNVINLSSELNIIKEENVLFKNNINSLQIELSLKHSIINNQKTTIDNKKSEKIEKINSPQVLYHKYIKQLINLIHTNDIIQDELIITKKHNIDNNIRYDEIKIKYQNVSNKLEDTIHLIDKKDIVLKDTIKELNLYKQFNLTKNDETTTLKQNISNYINELDTLKKQLFEKDNYLKKLQKKYVNETPINQKEIININQLEQFNEIILQNEEVKNITKMSFQRGIKISRK